MPSGSSTQILIYDLWRHGLSLTPLFPHACPLSSQLLRLPSHLSQQWTHVLGFSIGSSIAASIAAYHPEAVSRVVVVALARLSRQETLG
jgi:pimeloyl-ACP methyl ester carboxylesterase